MWRHPKHARRRNRPGKGTFGLREIGPAGEISRRDLEAGFARFLDDELGQALVALARYGLRQARRDPGGGSGVSGDASGEAR